MLTGVLTTGLEILRLLAEAELPLTATAISERVGQHVSNVSRTLKVLAQAGYVRKPTYHSFAADLGVLTLAGSAASRMPEITRTRVAMRAAAQASGLQATLATVFRDQVLYLHRCLPGHEPISAAVAGGWPLHRSVVGLRLLLDQPVAQARAVLAAAARRYGWERPTGATPANPAACLVAARKRLVDGVLALHGWDTAGYVACAIRVGSVGNPLALSLDGPVPQGCATAAVAERQMRDQLTVAATAIRTSLESP